LNGGGSGVKIMSPNGSQQPMKTIFLEYRTPAMPECELLGEEINLQKRVVQLWFQSARAKEKKNPHFFKSDLPEQFHPSPHSCRLSPLSNQIHQRTS
jgi:hypothetical protein